MTLTGPIKLVLYTSRNFSLLVKDTNGKRVLGMFERQEAGLPLLFHDSASDICSMVDEDVNAVKCFQGSSRDGIQYALLSCDIEIEDRYVVAFELLQISDGVVSGRFDLITPCDDGRDELLAKAE